MPFEAEDVRGEEGVVWCNGFLMNKGTFVNIFLSVLPNLSFFFFFTLPFDIAGPVHCSPCLLFVF